MLIRRTNWIVAKNLDFRRYICVAIPEVKRRKGFKIKGVSDWQHNFNSGITTSTEIGFNPCY